MKCACQLLKQVDIYLHLILTCLLAFQTSAQDSSPAQTTAGRPASPVPITESAEVRDALTKLDIWLEGQRIRYDLPGFSVGVVYDQELIWSKGYGSPTLPTGFQLMTKPSIGSLRSQKHLLPPP